MSFRRNEMRRAGDRGTAGGGSSIELNHIGYGGFLLRDVIPRCIGCLPEPSARVCIVVATKRGSSIHSVFRKFTKSCFCWSVNPILKRWS